MPIKDDQINTFVKYINGKTELGKKSNLQFAWSDKNRLLMKESH